MKYVKIGIQIVCIVVITELVVSHFNLYQLSCEISESNTTVKLLVHANNGNIVNVDPGKYSYIENIRQDCGELCNTSRMGSPGPYFSHITSKINCKALFTNKYIDMAHNEQYAPKHLPLQYLSDFNMNGQIELRSLYLDRPYLGSLAHTSVWTKEDIKHQIKLAKEGMLRGTYSINETNALRDGLKYTPGVVGGRVLVIGSERPWVEACVLEAGAQEVVTLEYGIIKCFHPSIKTMTPDEFCKQYLDNTLGTFSAVVTFSSVEHSGLGRYGDALNPWGDIIAVARAWCVTKQNGGLAIGVMYNKMKDYLVFNAHRVYGKYRYPYLTTNWNQIYEGIGKQKIYVFSKFPNIGPSSASKVV